MLICLSLWSGIIAVLSNASTIYPVLDHDLSVIRDLTAQRHTYKKKTEINDLVIESTAVVVFWNAVPNPKEGLDEYELQYWKKSWFSSILPADGTLVLKETYAVLNDLSMYETLGFRVRRRKETWIMWKWMEEVDWGPWSYEIFLPPNGTAFYGDPCATKNRALFFTNAILLCILSVTAASLVGLEINNFTLSYSRKTSGNRTIHKLKEQVALMRERLDLAEAEIRNLLHFKGWGIDALNIEDLQALEDQLDKSLKAVRMEKSKLLVRLSDRHLCVVCYNEDKSILLLPCRHLCICNKCSTKAIQLCPICRSTISSTVSVFA